MRELLVGFLTSLAESHPYLLAACALIGFLWLARSTLHKARLFTQTVLKEVRGCGTRAVTGVIDDCLKSSAWIDRVVSIWYF